MELETLIVPITADAKGFTKGLDDAEGKASGFIGTISKIGGGVALGAIGLAGGAIAGLGAGLIDATKSAMEAENIQADLAATIKSTGGKAGMTVKSINNLASSLSKVTTFEDDTIVSGQNMLLTFTEIGKDVFPAASEAMLNLSQKMGTDLNSSAIQLGKALNNPIDGVSALTRVGVTFNDEQKNLIKSLQDGGDMAGAQNVILQELEKEFGGIARAAGETADGSLTRLNNMMGNLKEEVGTALLPVLTEFADFLGEELSKPEVQQAITDLATAVGDFAKLAIEKLPEVVTNIQILMSNLGDLYDKSKKVFEDIEPIITTWKDNVILIFEGFWDVVQGDWEDAGFKLGEITKNNFDLLDEITSGRIKSLNDIWSFGIDDLIFLMTNQKDWNGVGTIIIDLIKQGFNFGLNDLWNTIYSKLQEIARNITDFTSGFNAGLSGNYGYVPPTNIKPQIRKSGRASGGFMEAGETAWVGENGRELFTAGAGGGYVTPNNKLGGDSEIIGLLQQIASNKVDEFTLARALRDALLQGGF